MSINKRTVVSLFSGALGLDLGLDRAGFSILVTLEQGKFAAETIRRNRKRLQNTKKIEVIDRDIHEVTSEQILNAAGLKPGEVTIVTGGPACQTFSTAGSRGSVSDPRGTLFLEFLRVINDLQPRFFVMENVKGLLSAAIKHRPLKERGPGHPPLSPDEEMGSAFRYILEELRKTNYYIIFGLLNSADYGVPQVRERLILIGSRSGEPIQLPNPTHSAAQANAEPRWVTLQEGLEGLNDPNPTYKEFSEKVKGYLRIIPEGGNWRNLPAELQEKAIGAAYKSWGGRGGFLRRLSWNEPGPALTTDPTGKATMMCHPTEDRPLTVREYARLQQFPDDWEFDGSVSQQYTQIGNAVPVDLGKLIGLAIRGSMDKRKASSDRLGTVVCGTDGLLDRMAKRPKTMLNPPRMREIKDAAAAYEWRGGSQGNRSDLVNFIRQMAIPRRLVILREKTSQVTKALHDAYGSPNHDNKENPLDELIFIILSIMTTHPSYTRVYNNLKETIGEWEKLLDMPVLELSQLIKDTGLSNQKALRIISILNKIKEDFGEVSLDALSKMSDREAEDYLTSLPGIGEKVAKCVMMFSLGRQVLPVDTHVGRVSKRLGLINDKGPDSKIHKELENVVPPELRYSYHVNVLTHGQRVCLALNPRCGQCVVNELCGFWQARKNLLITIHSLPTRNVNGHQSSSLEVETTETKPTLPHHLA